MISIQNDESVGKFTTHGEGVGGDGGGGGGGISFKISFDFSILSSTMSFTCFFISSIPFELAIFLLIDFLLN